MMGAHSHFVRVCPAFSTRQWKLNVRNYKFKMHFRCAPGTGCSGLWSLFWFCDEFGIEHWARRWERLVSVHCASISLHNARVMATDGCFKRSHDNDIVVRFLISVISKQHSLGRNIVWQYGSIITRRLRRWNGFHRCAAPDSWKWQFSRHSTQVGAKIMCKYFPI